MGKNSKVLLDNGKEASSSMQLYWNKAKQIQKKKQEIRKQENKEKRSNEMQQKSEQTQENQGGKDDDEKSFMSKEAMSNIMKEKERRRQGQYSSNSSDVISEASIINAQKAMTNKGLKIPGYSNDFISQQQVERNKREMDKRKEMAQSARERKEQREKKEQEAGQPQKPQPLVDGQQKPPQQQQQQQQPTPLINRPPFDPHRQQQQQQQNRPPFQQYPHYQKPRENQETNDPFFKVTEKEDYNPIEERQKQLQQKQQIQAQRGVPQNMPLTPQSMPPPPNMPPPPLIGQNGQPIYPPFYGMGNQFPIAPQFGVPTLPVVVAAAPVPLVPTPIVVEGESTVKKSKIDLTQKKQQFVPRSVITSVATGGIANNGAEKKQVQQPEALGGNIQNVSQAPAPKPFFAGNVSNIISNSNNQDLLKMFLSDIESISKNQKDNNNE